MRYFYAPISFDTEKEQYAPGMQSELGITPATLPVPCSSPLCDRGDAQRFVMAIPEESYEAPSDWELKTKEQVNTDYPDLIP
jgi:hypothetical protein